MNPSEIFISLVIISAVAVGMSALFLDVADNYRPLDTTDDFTTFDSSFNVRTSIDADMTKIQASITNVELLNPLTWGNVVTLVISAFGVILLLPTLLMTVVSSMLGIMIFIPDWVVWLSQLVVLILMVFATLGAINKWKS